MKELIELFFYFQKIKRANNILAVSTLLYLYCLWFFMAFTGFSGLWIRQLLIHLQIFTQMTTASSACVQIPLSSGKMWGLHHKPQAYGNFWGHFCHPCKRIIYQPSDVFPCQAASVSKSRFVCDAVCDARHHWAKSDSEQTLFWGKKASKVVSSREWWLKAKEKDTQRWKNCYSNVQW